MNGFTKLYKEERELLRKINTGAAYEVYMHLKDKYRYYNKDVYSYMKCIAEYLEMSEITVKRTIKKLKEVGLIECRREWTKDKGVPKCSNYYSFPIVDMIEKSEYKKEETPKEEKKETEIADTALSAEVQKVITENEGVINMNVERIARYNLFPTDLGKMRAEEALNKLSNICSELDPKKQRELSEHITNLITHKQFELQYNRN